MSYKSIPFPAWLTGWMALHEIALWGAADLQGFSTPVDERGENYPFAISFAIPMQPHIMMSIQQGPNQEYTNEYVRVNKIINALSAALTVEIKNRQNRAQPLAASQRTDYEALKGAFPHKTAATRAGLGWIGRNCQLITRPFGPWVRLGTVFTDMVLPFGPVVAQDHCGGCMRCVQACPAQALTGNSWYPGLPREDILDARACDHWKKTHYDQFHAVHRNCGICSAVCPYGVKIWKEMAKINETRD